jgi:DNA-binding response OmpR family regulator
MHILIIEDETSIRQELKQLLENSLYRVTAFEWFREETGAGSGRYDIVSEIIRVAPDLVLLDVNLPGESGFDICKRLRAVSDVPVIFATGRTDSMDELSGMLGGGDDYITKPFNPPILLAHIAAVLKRARKDKEGNGEKDKEGVGGTRICYKDVELDVAGGFVWYQGKRADLSKNELKILYYLFCHRGEIVPRVDLVEYLWDNQVFIDDNALSVNVTRLRGKLADIGILDFIETKRGMGYRI